MTNKRCYFIKQSLHLIVSLRFVNSFLHTNFFPILTDINIGCARDFTNRTPGCCRDSCNWSQALTKRKERGQPCDVRGGANRANC